MVFNLEGIPLSPYLLLLRYSFVTYLFLCLFLCIRCVATTPGFERVALCIRYLVGLSGASPPWSPESSASRICPGWVVDPPLLWLCNSDG